MLYFSDSLPILTFLVLLMSFIDCREILSAIGGCVGVENPYVEKCILPCTPETSGTNVCTSFILCLSQFFVAISSS